VHLPLSKEQEYTKLTIKRQTMASNTNDDLTIDSKLDLLESSFMQMSMKLTEQQRIIEFHQSYIEKANRLILEQRERLAELQKTIAEMQGE
jgi:hypothetical protein